MSLSVGRLVIVWARGAEGRSLAQASQVRKLLGFTSVHIGQDHVGGELVVVAGFDGCGCLVFGKSRGVWNDDSFAVREEGGFWACGGVSKPAFELKVRFSVFHAPAGNPAFLASSSCTSSHNASAMARSLASSSSALVRNPLFFASSTAISSPCLVLDAQPCVMVSLRAAASAMTCRISVPRMTGAPPSLRPEPPERILRRSADTRA